jgi:hypothetical protein
MTARCSISLAAGCVLAALSIPRSWSAPTPNTARPEPRLVVERTVHDAGRVTGGVVAVDFPLRNVGGAPLTIFDVKTDCGCLVPSFTEVIAAGGTGNVRVALRTDGFQGPVEKHVYLECDDPKTGSVMFTIKALLPRAVEAVPGPEVVVAVTRGQAATAEVTLRSTDGDPLSLGAVESTEPSVTAGVLPGTEPVGQSVRLQITVGADAPSDSFEARLIVNTGHSRLRRLALTLFAQPAAGATVRPPRLAFGRVRPGDPGPIERVLTITHPSAAFKILKVEDTLGCLEAHATAGPTPTCHEVRVVYRGGWKEDRTRGVIRITTDSASQPVIEIPYSAEVW